MAAMAVYAQPARTIVVENPSAIKRKDALIVLTRAEVQQKTGVIPRNRFITVQYGKMPVVVQLDDLDQDGVWDEAAWLHTFRPKQQVSFSIAITTRPAAVKAVVRAHVRQKHKLPDNTFGPSLARDTMPYNNPNTDFTKQKLPPFLTEGPAWENDKVGFRKYFDVRNTVDIWGKVTPRMVLDEVGADPARSYHHFDSAWGMDILKVGKSLGAGALALQTTLDGKDTLVRFGRNVQHTIYEQVADGPVRAIFRIRYQNWKIAGLSPIQVTEEISIWGGQYFYENKVTATGLPAGARLVTGLINFYPTIHRNLDTLQVAGISSYGKQSENADELGMAVLAARKKMDKEGLLKTGDVTDLQSIVLAIRDGEPLRYRFFACWSRSDKAFTTEEGFASYLQKEAIQFSEPLKWR